MTLPEFKDLLRRYQAGETTPDEVGRIDRWYEALNEDVPQPDTLTERAQLKARLWQRIDEQTADETPVRPLLVKQRPSWQRTGAVAAAAFVMLIFAWQLWMHQRATTADASKSSHFGGTLATMSAGLVEQQAEATGRWVRLPDQSHVYLNPHAAIRYAPHLATHERVVYLTGDAFFRVTKDPRRPFRVVTERVETQVLGTSFWMKAQPTAKQVAVEVLTGRVQVYERTAAETPTLNRKTRTAGVILTPNQQVTVTDHEHWQTGLVANPRPIVPDDVPVQTPPAVALRYEDTSFAEIIRQLSQRYGIDLVLANPAIATCTFTGDLTGQPFYTQLDLLCSTINARYDVRGTRILISGHTCQ